MEYDIRGEKVKGIELLRDIVLLPAFIVLFAFTWLYGNTGLLIARWQLRKIKPEPDAILIHARRKK